MDDTIEWLSRLCAIFAARTRRRLSTVSRLATGSGETIARLKRGRTITIRRAARAFQYLSDHWPDDQEWPTEIPRPKAVIGKSRTRSRRGAVRDQVSTNVTDVTRVELSADGNDQGGQTMQTTKRMIDKDGSIAVSG